MLVGGAGGAGMGYYGYHNYNQGMYNDYNYRPDKYAGVKGDTCVNNLEFDGIVLGQFICPIEGIFIYIVEKLIFRC